MPAHPTWTGALLGLFLHGDWFHLSGNALYLWVFGRQIESRLGSVPLFLLFIGGGMAASWLQGMATPADSWARYLRIIGASGSMAALLGMTVVRFPHRRVRIAYFLFTIIGAVVGVQPFGGQGLSGTGPKAGGPHSLLRFCNERAISRNIMAEGGDPALLGL